MPTIKQFEAALDAQFVQIEAFKTPNNREVREAIGYKDGKRMIWNASGQCFQNKVRVPENDLKFTENDSLSN